MLEINKPNYPIESVDRALRLLSILCTRPAVSLADVADELSITRSSAHRLAAMFLWHGYARQDPRTKDYVVGPRLLELGLGVLRQIEIAGHARPLLREIAERFDETVHLVALNGIEVSYIDGIESSKALRAGLRIGMARPSHATAAGKVLLAGLPVAEFEALYPEPNLPPSTPNTIVRRTDLDRELEHIRARGYAVNNQESEPGLSAVAVALPDPTELIQAAVSVTVPSVRADDSFVAELGQLMVERVGSLAESG